MAVSASKTWIAGEVLAASDLNNEFLNIYGNGEILGWPSTKTRSLAGFELTLDSNGDTSMTADTDDLIDWELSGFDAIGFDGTAGTLLNGLDIVASVTNVDPSIVMKGETNVGLDLVMKGVGQLQSNGDTVTSVLSGQFFS